jgi:hypothetical protein
MNEKMPLLHMYRTPVRGAGLGWNRYDLPVDHRIIGAYARAFGRCVSLQWCRPDRWDWKPLRCLLGAHEWSPVMRIGYYMRMCRQCYKIHRVEEEA